MPQHPYEMAADVANAATGLVGPIGPAAAAGFEYLGAPDRTALPQALAVGLGGFTGGIGGGAIGSLAGAGLLGGVGYLGGRLLSHDPDHAMEDARNMAALGLVAGAGFGSGLGAAEGGRYGRALVKQASAEYDLLAELVKLSIAGGKYTANAYPAVTGPDSYAFEPTSAAPQAQIIRPARPAAPSSVQGSYDHTPQSQVMRRAQGAAPRQPAPVPVSQYALPQSGNYDDLVSHYDKVWWDNQNPHRERQLTEAADKIRDVTIGSKGEPELMSEYWNARNSGAGQDVLEQLERNILVHRSGGHMGNMSFNAASPNYGREILREQLANMAGATAGSAPTAVPAARKTPALLNRFKTLVSGLF